MRSETDIREHLRTFAQRHAGEATITDDTPLFTLGILRSIHLLEMIILLERLRGAPIDVEQMRMGDFDSIDIIMARFGAQP
jgi:hypothetical protein